MNTLKNIWKSRGAKYRFSAEITAKNVDSQLDKTRTPNLKPVVYSDSRMGTGEGSRGSNPE